MSEASMIDSPIEVSTQYRQNANASVGTEEFPEHLLRWLLWGALQRQSIEAHLIDQSDPVYLAAANSFGTLAKSSGWITPELKSFLEQFGKVIGLKELNYELRSQSLRSNGSSVDMLERHVPNKYVKVSNRTVDHIPVVDDTFSRANLCRNLVDLFIKRLQSLCQKTGATHLLFIEKEYGPIGAVLMYTSVITSLNMPACILREMHLGQRFFVGEAPRDHDRVVIAYDLCVSGNGMEYAAQLLADTYGSQVAGALVFRKYSARKALSYTGRDGRKETFPLEALSIHEESCVESRHEREVGTNSSHVGDVVGNVPSLGVLASSPAREERMDGEIDSSEEGVSEQQHLEPPPWAWPMPEEERARLSDPRNFKRPPVKRRPQMTAEQLKNLKADTYRREREWVRKCEEAERQGQPIPPHPFSGF